MGQAFKSSVQVVQVRTDEYVRGVAKLEYWAVAAAPEQAVMLVLASVPEGFAVSLSDRSPGDLPGLQPGELQLMH